MEYLYFRARTYHELKEYTKAISDLLIITQLDKDGSYIKNERYVLNDLGTYYKRLENYDKALEYYTKEINLNQDDHLPYLVRAELYAFNINDNEKAVSDFSKAIELDSSASNYYKRAWFYNDIGDYSKALLDYNKALELDPDNMEILFNRAYNYEELGEYEKAISDHLRIIELDKDGAFVSETSDFFNNLAVYYERIENHDKALEYYTKEINLYPDDHLAYLNRALLYTSDLNDNEKALIDFNKAIELDPTVKTYRNRAWFYNDIEDYNKALQITIKPLI